MRASSSLHLRPMKAQYADQVLALTYLYADNVSLHDDCSAHTEEPMSPQQPPPRGSYGQGPQVQQPYPQHDYQPHATRPVWGPPAPKTSHQTLFIVLGALGAVFAMTMCGAAGLLIVHGASSEAESTPGPITLAPAGPAPTPARDTGRRTSPSKGNAGLDTTEFRTKSGYVVATSKDKLETAVSLVAAGDRAAFAQYVKSTPGVSISAGNDVVTIVDSDGVFGSTVRVRKRGETAAYWTVREALER